jgi:hypothetical protein
MKINPYMIKKTYLLLALFALPLMSFSQDKEEDETKMVREIISVMVDKAKFAAPPTPTPPPEDHSKKGKKKHQEEVPAPAPDTGNPMIPAPASEIAKRAQNWLDAKSPKYTKANGSNTGGTVGCNISFVFKQKILNPENDVDGKISMDVVIDVKEGKYRYTLKNISHVADKSGMSGGSIYEKVPECGSMKMTDQTWKQIKSAAYGNIQLVIDDLKAKMKEDGGGPKKKDDW